MARLAPHTPAAAHPEPLTPTGLELALRAVDPAVLLVAPRILRRVIKQHAGVSGIGVRVPHRKTYVISRVELLTIVDRSELDLRADAVLPENVILIARPTAESLDDLRPEEVLIKFWRQLFHARVHLHLEQAILVGRLSEADIRARIRRIGESEFKEIRAVLRQEDYLLPPRDDRSVFVEFVAVYLELRHFMPGFLQCYFPSLHDLHAIDDLLAQDIDAEALLAASRPLGAADPSQTTELFGVERMGLARADEPKLTHTPRRVYPKSDRTARALLDRADRISKLGNQVRAAILRTKAAHYATHDLAGAAREQARSELVRLAQRLQAALNLADAEADEWTRSLVALSEGSARGIWTAEARMLYDLQKVCVDHERGIYTLDLLGWVLSLGSKPLKRYLPGQRDVLISKHLRSAERRLPAARLSHRNRSRFAGLLHKAVYRAETNLRMRFKPLVDRALDRVQLLPQNPPERVARKKLVDELLDRIVERGFLSMGDLRDAISRNNLKLPDLASAKQFWLGDQLLLADKQLGGTLDGVYRSGEVYLRWPQRLSSLAFGTPPGRFLTRYVALPFGGAYIILDGAHHLVNELVHLAGGSLVQVFSWQRWFVLGVFLLGLLHYQRFRVLCLQAALHAGRAAHTVCIDWPSRLRQLPLVQKILQSWEFRLFKRYVFKPGLVALVVAPALDLVLEYPFSLRNFSLVFLGVNLVLNSRIGRNVDEMVTDWVVHTWHRLRIHVFAALFRFIMEIFNRFLEAIERLLYTVDEWLRFRAGERPLATATKAVLGAIWFFVNYVIRFCVNLLIEPQVNPIKHFPVVTVSHKVLLPLTFPLQSALAGPLGAAWAKLVAPTIILVTPGIFGFLVWELKENWRLYAANRPRRLKPVSIGHHGETLLQFLRPGFRSGTIPKLYAKLRRASRKAYWTHNWRAATKYHNGLHHTSEAIRRFVERELLELLHESESWADRTISCGEIRLGGNRILIELYFPHAVEESMWLAFEEQSGWLVASIYQRGWIDTLTQQRRHTLASALAGFYKMAGVDLVREQIESQIDPGAPGYRITDRELWVWPRREGGPLVFHLRDWPLMDDPTDQTNAAERERWVFSATPITWRRWVVTWELEELGGISKHRVLDNMHLLPG